ncbi:tetratricopeptide repeat protein [Bradyrhizobium aeschynomenes]|uniref:tetratricopeptide repeat protein n=1 Tax=Bradyrhizobium aeschynomenes TaxID=2734909 RepID=UPI001552B2D2|nr:tetratricopeptide repeat protein [Bradyrhizobium aeschynomenes]NPV19646.1 tetratricopeptide repeat protein [Bradyrhizobium aeschynomenes]
MSSSRSFIPCPRGRRQTFRAPDRKVRPSRPIPPEKARSTFFQVLGYVYEHFSTIVTKVLGASAALLLVLIVVRGLMQHALVIDQIAVPKVLADRGYSPDVAAHLLRDRILKYLESLETRVERSQVALHGELPNIVVPTVGISIDAVLSYVRSLFQSTRSQSVSGEFVVSQGKLQLRLRINGQQFFSESDGDEAEDPEKVIAAAIPELIKRTQPYLAALALASAKKTDAALDLIEQIVSEDPPSKDVAWAYNLRGAILHRRKKDGDAIEALKIAIAHNANFAAAHLNLSNVWRDAGDMENALSEARAAVRVDPTYYLAHDHLGRLMRQAKRLDEAIDEHRKAVRLNPTEASVHSNLGVALLEAGKRSEGIEEYRKAIRWDPGYAIPHYNLASALREDGEINEAIEENRKATKLDPGLSEAHNNLGNLLRLVGQIDEAISEFRTAADLEKGNEQYKVNLGRALDQAGRASEAVEVFQSVLTINQSNEEAKGYLSLHAPDRLK